MFGGQHDGSRQDALHHAPLSSAAGTPTRTVAVPFLISAAWRAGWLAAWPGADGAGAHVWFLGLLAVAFAASILIGRWYDTRFGVVTFRHQDSGVISFVGFAACLVVVVALQLKLEFAWSMPLLFIAGVLMILGLQRPCPKPHYVAIAI